jgi:signal-transduction protein with cAMP-binding, CBS, and nucleotidyltransferase domain
MYFVLRGSFKVAVGDATVRMLGEGDHFGELALFEKGTRTATVTCETRDNLVLRLSYRKFCHLNDRFPMFAGCLRTSHYIGSKPQSAVGKARIKMKEWKFPDTPPRRQT